MTTEVFGSRSGRANSEFLDDKARRAVSNFRSLQPTLTAYARILSGKSDVRVVAAATDNGSTNGTEINFRPPLALGDTTPHQRRLCDKRDEDGLHLCPACRIREEVLVTIYHEIAHICFESFQQVSPEDKKQAILFAVREAKGKWAEQIAHRIETAPAYKTRDYINLVSLINEYLPFLLNALEDARVNRELFKARPGVKRMFDADTEKIFRDGFEARRPDGTFETCRWNEAPLNNQMMIGCFCKASGYDYSNWFHPDVVRDLNDAELTELINELDTARNARAVYNLSFKVLARLRELGYCGTPQDPDPDPKPEPEESDESDESSDESSKEGAPGSDPVSGESGVAGESDDRDGSGDASGDESDERSEEEGGESSSDGTSSTSEEESDEGSGSGDDNEGSGGQDDSSDSEDSESERDSSSSSGDSRTVDESSSASGESEASGESNESSSGDSEGSKTGNRGGLDESPEGSSKGDPGADESTESGDGSEGGSDSRDPRGDQEEGEGAESSGVSSEDQSGSSVDEEDNLDAPESSEGEGDLGDVDSGGSQGLGSGGDDRGAAEQEDGSSDDTSVATPHEGDSGEESSEDGDPLDTGADDGYGGTSTEQESRPEMGSVDDLTGVLELWGDHEEKPKSAPERAAEQAENDAVDKAVIQGIYFTRPSTKIYGVREHYFGQPIIEDGLDYSHAWRGSGNYRRTGAIVDIDVPESIISPALLRTRRAFTDNKRGAYLRNRKSGRVNSTVLGRRAWNDDPRLFQKNLRPGKKDYFVILSMDVSGSTVGVNLALEKRAIMAQATLLDRAGIPFAIYAHTGNFADQHNPTKGLNLEVYHIKDPKEPWSDKEKQRLADIKSSSANLDGHALEYLRKVCDTRPETDKIIMYYSDGQMPAENFSEELEILQSEIKTCKNKGYTLLGVGIRTDSPRAHGLDTVEVNEDKDLIQVVKHLEKRLEEVR